MIVVFVVSENMQAKRFENFNFGNDTKIKYDTNSSKDQTISFDALNGVFYGENCTLQLSEGKYILINEDETCYFTGDADIINGPDVLKHISKYELLKKGLSYNKINKKNLFYVKAWLFQHNYGSNIEYYNKELNGDKELSLDFLIYFKEKSDGSGYMVGIAPVHSLPQDFSVNCF